MFCLVGKYIYFEFNLVFFWSFVTSQQQFAVWGVFLFLKMDGSQGKDLNKTGERREVTGKEM